MADGLELMAGASGDRRGLSGRSRSSNRTHETDRRNQMNQTPATRRKKVGLQNLTLSLRQLHRLARFFAD